MLASLYLQRFIHFAAQEAVGHGVFPGGVLGQRGFGEPVAGLFIVAEVVMGEGQEMAGEDAGLWVRTPILTAQLALSQATDSFTVGSPVGKRIFRR